MSDLSPGQEVTVSGMSGGTAYVVYVKGETVRVRMADGRRRTTRLENVTPKRESKALSVLVVGERPATFTRDAIIAAETDHILLLAKLDGVEVPNLLAGQPDDPGPFARTCLRCGLDEGLGAMRLCARCCPPAPWWAHLCRWLPCVARRWGL